MNTTVQYLFTSQRLGFRDWEDADLVPMAAINADEEVMKFFPATQTFQQTADFILRMKAQLASKGFTYFAVDSLADRTLMGFIGLSVPTFEADFTPCVDLGWRLCRNAWGKGFATEGARRCLKYAFEELQLAEVIAIAPGVNEPSENVMKKIGMTKVKDFRHPLLANNERLETCILYRIVVGELAFK